MRPLYGLAIQGTPWAVSMFSRRLSISIHSDDANASACNEIAVKRLAAGLWLILQSDKGISSPRLAEALGVSQPTAWRMGHALRLLVAEV